MNRMDPVSTPSPFHPRATDPRQPSASTGRRPGIRAILGASLLSAALATASTTALLGLASGSAAGPNDAAATPNALVVSDDTTFDIADVVARASESVVTITAGGTPARGLTPFSVPTTGVGSGVILTSDGYILTNRHVVDGSDRLIVTLSDGTELTATIVAESPDTDLALIKVDASDLAAATIGDSTAVEVGDTAIAIGSPLGTYTETVTRGIISATGRAITFADERTGRPTRLENLLQTDAAINPGNSGGPLLGATGAVVGIATAVAESAEGIGFAIPIDAAADLIAQARASTTG
jgi:S1-C subfamily serine protease